MMCTQAKRLCGSHSRLLDTTRFHGHNPAWAVILISVVVKETPMQLRAVQHSSITSASF